MQLGWRAVDQLDAAAGAAEFVEVEAAVLGLDELSLDDDFSEPDDPDDSEPAVVVLVELEAPDELFDDSRLSFR